MIYTDLPARRGGLSRNSLPAGAALTLLTFSLGLALLVGGTHGARAEETYTSVDGKLTFSFPRRWQAETVGQRVRLTAPDGTHYFLDHDTISALPGDSPAANPELKTRAAELVKPLLKDAAFAGAQPITLDHGLGAVFRFHGAAKSDSGPATPIYLAFVGRHSVVVLPEKAGQSSQSIGLAGIFQSLAFTDELPKPASQRGPATRPAIGGTPAISGPGTVSYATQIAPVFKEKCEVCHRSTAPLGGFSVTSYSDVIRGGRHGSLILAGRPEASSLMDYLTGKRELMPKGGPQLPSDQIALIRKWISEGAREQVGGSVATTGGGDMANPSRETVPGTGALRNRTRIGTQAGLAAGRLSRPGASAAQAGPQLLEGYTGHLIPNDLSFSLRLHMDKSASAVWSLAPGRDLRYAGTYVGQDGNYVVTLSQTNSPPADQGKTLSIELRARGSQETGIFGMDGARPRRDISELELSETRTSDKPSRPSRTNRLQNRQNMRRKGR